MNHYILIDAIGYLDADILAKHLERKEKLRKENGKGDNANFLVRSVAMVAGLAVLFVAGFMVRNIKKEPDMKGYGYTATYSLFYKGDTSASEYGTIEYVDKDECSITIVLDKKTNDNIYITLYGFEKDPTSERNIVYRGTSLPDTKEKDVILVEDALQIYVNGTLSADLPQSPGKYTIKIVYEKLKTVCDWLDAGIYIHGFDYFMIETLTIANFDPDEIGTDDNLPIVSDAERRKYLY